MKKITLFLFFLLIMFNSSSFSLDISDLEKNIKEYVDNRIKLLKENNIPLQQEYICKWKWGQVKYKIKMISKNVAVQFSADNKIFHKAPTIKFRPQSTLEKVYIAVPGKNAQNYKDDDLWHIMFLIFNIKEKIVNGLIVKDVHLDDLETKIKSTLDLVKLNSWHNFTEYKQCKFIK